jgi:hydrogenase nickel incorporation protein HypA/HybF
MHELALAERLVRMVVETATSAGGRPVKAKLMLGELAGVDQEALAFGFEITRRGTPADGCTLEVEAVPARLKCDSCGEERGGDLVSTCAACGAFGAAILAGREMRLCSVDVEQAAQQPGAGT